MADVLWGVLGVLAILLALGAGFGLILFLVAFATPPYPPPERTSKVNHRCPVKGWCSGAE